ncbi:AAA family ATPase, partial [Micromonospora peucetia]|uniref:HelD family protein n=1 Tax=Micromonospora peucetia TaxID=47871 RepID=UPI00334F7888
MTPTGFSVTDLDLDLDAEREHLATSRAALAQMRERARALFATGDQVAGDAYAAETLGRTLARRVAELADDPTTPLFFGRLDFGPAPEGEPGDGPDGWHADHAGRRYHVGRRHVTDDRGEPLVLDWRAPVSRSFYRASARDPQGVAVRRRFGFSNGTLTSFEDERLDRGEELGTTSRILTAEIERPRVGPMRDIVATIQPEQDELVRADLADSICVQGAPGTGKTAVGLHRAAYLLYLHRERLRRSGVLIVGPNRAFLSYIAAVLPALGEVEVEQATVEDLVGRVPVRAVDDPAVAAVKHDARMAEVLRRAVDAHIGEPTEPIMVSDGSFRWRIGLDPLHRVVEETRRERLPYATGRERVRARVVALLQRQAEARRAESPSDTWLRRMGRATPVTTFLDAVWPALTPEGLVHALITDPERLAAAADGLLSADEQARLRGIATPARTPDPTAAAGAATPDPTAAGPTTADPTAAAGATTADPTAAAGATTADPTAAAGATTADPTAAAGATTADPTAAAGAPAR